MVEWPLGHMQSVTGSLFQATGLATEKAQRCLVKVSEWKTRSSVCTDKQRENII